MEIFIEPSLITERVHRKEEEMQIHQRQHTKNYEKNILKDYIFSFLKNFDISSAVWVLYMGYRGLPLWQIGIVEGIFHIASFLFEVPSGALADLFGRKRVMIAGRICYALAAVIQIFSTNIYGFSIAFIICALSYNLNSGSEEALLYDSLKAVGKEGKYMSVYSRLDVVMQVAAGIATVAGGILAQKSYQLCYLVIVLVAVLSVLPAMWLEEPPRTEARQGKKQEKTGLKEHFTVTYQVIRDNPGILNILLYFPVVAAFSTALYFYGQQYYAEAGFDRIAISFIMLGNVAASCIGALYSEKLLHLFGNKTKYLASVCMGLAVLCVSRYHIWLSIPAFWLVGFCDAVLLPIESGSLNKLIPSGQRATIISVSSMFFSMAMICIFPLVGVLATFWGLHCAFAIMGILQLVMMVLLICRKSIAF